MNRDAIVGLILDLADELNATLEQPIPLEGEATPLYGREGVLDSLGLVSIVTGLEEAVEEKFDVLLTLADEKALARESSPFRTIGTLADYTWALIKEQANDA